MGKSKTPASLPESELLLAMRAKFGDSIQQDRLAIIHAFGGLDKMELAAKMWHTHHRGETVFVLFVTAVDIGYRIRKSEEVRGG